MQPRPEDKFYPQLLNRLRGMNRERKIELSDYSEQLLALSITAWFEDPVLFKPRITRNQEQLTELGVQIYELALEQPHVRIEMERRGRVSFGALLISLSDAGRVILSDLSETGF